MFVFDRDMLVDHTAVLKTVDFLWRNVSYLIKNNPYKIVIMTVVVYFMGSLHGIWSFIGISCIKP